MSGLRAIPSPSASADNGRFTAGRRCWTGASRWEGGPIAPSGEAKAGRRPRLIPRAVCPPTSPQAGPTLPVSPRCREVALSESLWKRWGWLAGQRPLTPAPLLLHHSAFILPGPGQAPPGVGSVQEAGAESGQLSAPGKLPCSRDCPRSQHLRGGYLYRDPKDGVEGSAHPDRANYRGPVKTSSGDCTRQEKPAC